MRKNNCEVIRRELDELMLDDTCSSAAIEHLRECAACREFHQKQTKLREIVGGLGTVAAPPDFDFRLRARLANEVSSSSFHLKSTYWPFVRRGFVVAVLLIVFATGIVLIRNAMNRQAVVAVKEQPLIESPAPKQSVELPKPAVSQKDFSAVVRENSPQRNKDQRPAQTSAKIRRPAVALDFSSQRADVFNGSVAASTAFPIDASLQSLRVSLDDGRGNARTISVPTITFGSQRVLQSGNQFAAKGVW